MPPRWSWSTSRRASSRKASTKIHAFMSQKPEGFDSLEEVAEAIASYQPHRQRPRNLDGLAKNVRLGDGRQVPLALGPALSRRRRDLEQRARAPGSLRAQR